MKYTDQKSRTVYEDIEIEVPDGVNYFKTFDEDDEPEYYYKLSIIRDKKFTTLYNILITKILNYSDNYAITYREECESELPYNLRHIFRGEAKKEEMTEEEFNKVKQEVLNKL